MAIERVGEDPRGWKFASTMLETKHSKGLKAGMQMSRRGRPRKRMLAVCRLRRQWASCHYVRRILKPHRVVLLCLLSRWWQATLCIRSATGPRLLSAHLIIRKSSARCQYTPLPPTSSVTLSTLSTPFPYLSLSPSSFMPDAPPRFLSREIPSLAQGLACSTCNSALIRTASLAYQRLFR